MSEGAHDEQKLAGREHTQEHQQGAVPLRCSIFGHDYAFTVDGPVMVWRCGRGCGILGSKTYETEQLARHYAAAFNKRDTDDLGRRAPLIGLLPLRLWRLFQSNNQRQRQ